MGLSSSHLEAFAAVAQAGGFSKAAKILHLTQSALSQRIMNLEDDLAITLFIRDPSGLRLTPAGDELLRYWQMHHGLEQEVLARIAHSSAALSGSIRIAGFSSIMRSLVMPAISDLVVESPRLKPELFTRELRDLPAMLGRSEADFVFTSSVLQKPNIASLHVGNEEYVLIKGTKNLTDANLYFDHDADDQTTTAFLKLQSNSPPKTMRRAYLGEIYAIIDAVESGWGKAVVPKHLVQNKRGISIVGGMKSMKVPVYLHYYQQPFYSKLNQTILKTLTDRLKFR